MPGLGRSPGEGMGYSLQYSGASLVAQLVKSLPAMWETWVRFLGWEDLIPWRRDRLPTPVFQPGEFHGLYSPWGPKESDTTEQLVKNKNKNQLTNNVMLTSGIYLSDSVRYIYSISDSFPLQIITKY